MKTETLRVKVSRRFAAQYRAFCESRYLDMGMFAENALREMMEDHALGTKAQKILSQHQNNLGHRSEVYKD